MTGTAASGSDRDWVAAPPPTFPMVDLDGQRLPKPSEQAPPETGGRSDLRPNLTGLRRYSRESRSDPWYPTGCDWQPECRRKGHPDLCSDAAMSRMPRAEPCTACIPMREQAIGAIQQAAPTSEMAIAPRESSVSAAAGGREGIPIRLGRPSVAGASRQAARPTPRFATVRFAIEQSLRTGLAIFVATSSGPTPARRSRDRTAPIHAQRPASTSHLR